MLCKVTQCAGHVSANYQASSAGLGWLGNGDICSEVTGLIFICTVGFPWIQWWSQTRVTKVSTVHAIKKKLVYLVPTGKSWLYWGETLGRSCVGFLVNEGAGATLSWDWPPWHFCCRDFSTAGRCSCVVLGCWRFVHFIWSWAHCFSAKFWVAECEVDAAGACCDFGCCGLTTGVGLVFWPNWFSDGFVWIVESATRVLE